MSRMLLAALLVPAAATAEPSVQVNNTTANPVPVTVTNPGGQVQVTNTPSVTVTNPVQVTGSVQVTNTPTVTVANQPGVGTLYSEHFFVSTGASGGSIAATGGTAVPAGTRRTINTASASWSCDKGKSAMVQLSLNATFNNGSVFGGQGSVYLPGQLQVTTTFSGSQDTYAGTQALNLTVPPQGSVTPIVTMDFNSNCFVTVWVFGVETASSP